MVKYQFKTVFFILLTVLSVVFLSYYSSLNNDFVLWDDDVHLFDNISVRMLDAEHIDDIFSSKVNSIYIPLTTLSFAIEYHFFKYNEFYYHLDNLILHLGVIAFIFFIGLRLGLSLFAAAAASLLFGLHPMHVESVAWVTERKDVLYSFFYMASVLSYLTYLDSKKYFYFIITICLGILSVLAKPMALSLPIILLLCDWFKQRKIAFKVLFEKAYLCLFMVPIVFITYFSHARLPGGEVWQGILIWPWTFTFYLRQFLFPIFSTPIYRLPEPVAFTHFQYAASLMVLLLSIVLFIRLRNNRWFIFASLFYFFSIFFLLRFDGLADTNIVADRFMYLPSVGFCFLFGMGVEKLWKWKKSSIIGIIAVLTLFGFQTYKQCKVWKDSVSLWQQQLRYFPNEKVALNNLAIALIEQKDKKDFLKKEYNVNHVKYLYEKAIRLDPEFIDSYYNLGKLYKDIGQNQKAIYYYQQTLALDPMSTYAFFSLGNLFRDAGEVDNAIQSYQDMIKANPEKESSYIEVITAYTKRPKADEKNEKYIQESLNIAKQLKVLVDKNPPRATSYFNLGTVLGQVGDLKGAIRAYQKALKINPNHSKSLQNLANAYFSLGFKKEMQGLYAQAMKDYQKSIEINPENAEVYYNLGNVFAALDLPTKAMEEYLKALTYDAQHVNALVNLSILSFKQRKYADAVKYCDKAIKAGYDAPEGYLKTLEPYRKN